MDLNFLDPEDAPLPRADVRFRSLTAAPYPDGRRVRLSIHLTPFQHKPNVEVEVHNAAGVEVATMSIIEAMQYR